MYHKLLSQSERDAEEELLEIENPLDVPLKSLRPRVDPLLQNFLPPELVRHIFLYATSFDLVHYSQVSKSWNRVTKDPTLWILHHAGGFRGLVADYNARVALRNEEALRALKHNFLLHNHVYRKLSLFTIPMLLLLLPLLVLLKLEKLIYWAWVPTVLPLALFFAFLAQLHLCLLRHSASNSQVFHQARKGIGFMFLFLYIIYLASATDGGLPRPYNSSLYTVLPGPLLFIFIFSPPLPTHREILDVLFQIEPANDNKCRSIYRVLLIFIFSTAFLLFGLIKDHYLQLDRSIPFLLIIWLLVPLLSQAGFKYFRPITVTDVDTKMLVWLWQISLWLIPFMVSINYSLHKSFVVLFVPYWNFLLFSALSVHFRLRHRNRFQR